MQELLHYVVALTFDHHAGTHDTHLTHSTAKAATMWNALSSLRDKAADLTSGALAAGGALLEQVQ